MRWAVGVGVCAAVALVAPAARAQCEHDAVIAELRQGVRLRQRNRDPEALALFESLWRRCGELQALAQMAQTEVALERWLAAHEHLTEALGERHANHAGMRQLRPILEDSLRETERHLVAVRVRTNGPSARVQVDDGDARPLPDTLWTTPGAHTLRVSAPGHRMESRAVTLAAGTTFDAEINLQPEALPPPSVTVTTGPRLNVLTPRETVIERRSPWRTTGFVLLGVGAALIGPGVYFWARSSDARDASQDPSGAWWAFTDQLSDAQRGSVEAVCEAAQTHPNGGAARELCASAESYRQLAYAFVATGAVVAVGGAIMAVLGRPIQERVPARPDASRVTLAPLLGGHTQGVLGTWTF